LAGGSIASTRAENRELGVAGRLYSGLGGSVLAAEELYLDGLAKVCNRSRSSMRSVFILLDCAVNLCAVTISAVRMVLSVRLVNEARAGGTAATLSTDVTLSTAGLGEVISTWLNLRAVPSCLGFTSSFGIGFLEE
jgi:hypothetical protein